MSTQKLLYVVDNHDCRKVIKKLLERLYDCKADTAENGLSGVETALKNNYGVIIMDIGLPDIDGVEAVRRIKEVKPNQIIVSSSGHACLPEDTPQDIFDANFPKPFALKLKDFSNFCLSVGVDLTELNRHPQGD